MAPIQDLTAGGGSVNYAYVGGTTGPQVVKATAGRLQTVIVTATGTAGLNIFDNASAASGTVICAIPASAPVGSIYHVQMPAANGITIGGAASTPSITLSYQ